MKRYFGLIWVFFAVSAPFNSINAESEQPKPFSLIIASDVQLVSTNTFKDVIDYNISRVRAGMVLYLMNDLIKKTDNSKPPVIGCIINGDMSQGPTDLPVSTIEADHDANYKDFMLGYNNSFSQDDCKGATLQPSDMLLSKHKLSVPVFPGMGNHDLNTSSEGSLNGWDCISKVIEGNDYTNLSGNLACSSNTCILDPLSFPDTTQAKLALSPEDIYEVYFVDIGNWRFIQTNWGMTDQKYNKLIAIMKDAAELKLNIVICGHYFLSDSDAEGVTQLQAYFQQMSDDSSKAEVPFLPYLKAFICGHVHKLIGYNKNITIQGADPETTYNIPLYYNGCSGWFNASWYPSPLHFTVFTFTGDTITGSAYTILNPNNPYLELGATDDMIPDNIDLDNLPGKVIHSSCIIKE